MSLRNTYYITLLAFGIVFVLYYATVKSLFLNLVYDPSPYAHGLLILVISIVLIAKAWINKREPLYLKVNLYGALLLFIFSFGWFLASIAYIEILQNIFFILLLIAIIIALYGHEVAKDYYVPAGLLALGLPIWSIFVPFFQNATVVATLFLLKLSGITSIAEGIYISIPEGTFKIATLCSGMRYQVAAIVLTITYSYWNKITLSRTIIYVFTVSFFAFLANLIRVFIVIVSGHITNMQHSFVTEDHVSLGWVLFAITMFTFFYILSRTERAEIKQDNLRNSNSVNIVNFNNQSYKIALYIMFMFGLFFGPILINAYENPYPPDLETKTKSSAQYNGWRIVRNDLGDRAPIWKKGDVVYSAQYSNGNSDIVDLFISHFYFQKESREAISVVNILYDPYKWETLNEKLKYVVLDSTTTIHLKETTVIENLRLKKISKNQARKRLIWSWYQIGDRTEPKSYLAKIWNLLEILKGNSEISVFILSTDFDGNYDSARNNLTNFTQNMLNNIEL